MTLSSMINEILQHEDIEGFIEGGAPSDEYLSEAEKICNFINRFQLVELSTEIIAAEIYRLWGEDFNLSPSELNLRRPLINHAAQRIMSIL